MITWKILTTKLFFKHGINMEQNDKMNNLDNKTIVQTWDGIHLVVGLQLLSSCLEPVEKCLKLSLFREKYFWNHHYKKVILRSQLFPTCPKENGHRCLKSGWKQVGGTWSAVAARPTRPPILCSMYAVRCGVVRWLLNLKGIFLSWWQLLPYLMRIGGHCAEEGHVDILEKGTL